MKQGKSTHIETGQDSPIGGKESQEQTKESKTYSLLLGVPQNCQANSHDIYAEVLVQTLPGSLLVASFSVSQYEPCLVDWVYRILLESMTRLSPTRLSPKSKSSSSSLGFLEIQGEGPGGDL